MLCDNLHRFGAARRLADGFRWWRIMSSSCPRANMIPATDENNALRKRSVNVLNQRVDPLAPLVRRLIAPAWAWWRRPPLSTTLPATTAHAVRPPQRGDTTAAGGADPKACKPCLPHDGVLSGAVRGGWPSGREYRFTRCLSRRAADDQSRLAQNSVRNSARLTARPDNCIIKKPPARRAFQWKSSSMTPPNSSSVLVPSEAMNGRAGGLESGSLFCGGPQSALRKGFRAWLPNALLERTTLLDTLKITVESMSRFATALRKHPPSLIFGHAHSLYLFAQFLSSKKDDSIRPQGIISTAMVLHDWETSPMKRSFSAMLPTAMAARR